MLFIYNTFKYTNMEAKVLQFSINEIQKNPAIFSKTNQMFEVVNKKTNKVLGVFTPTSHESVIESISSKYKSAKKTSQDLKEEIELTKQQVMGKKYGLSS